MMSNRFPASLGLLLAACLPMPSAAQMVETAFTYQGELTVAGVPANTPHDFEFRLFNAESFGEPIGPTVGVDEVPVQGGLFNVLLDFGPGQFAGDAQWLEIRVRAAGEGAFQVLSPRTPVTPAPYAIAALHALDGSVTGASIVDGSIQGSHLAPGAVGAAQVDGSEVQLRLDGECPPGAFMQSVDALGSVECGSVDTGGAWSIGGNAGTDDETHFLGTTDQQPLVLRTGNARSLRIEPSAALSGGLPITSTVLAGSHANTVDDVRGATIAGGGVPAEDIDPTVIGGGPNHVSGHYSTISGGGGNWAGPSAGDSSNRPYSSVGGGDRNRATGTVSTIAGGRLNLAPGNFTAVAGGRENTASGFGSAVGGGLQNRASGLGSSVIGGEANTASGDTSAVLAGDLNCAGGAQSLAAGHRAKVRPGTSSGLPGVGCDNVGSAGTSAGDRGTFVWADAQDADFTSTGTNQFLVRAGGGMAINSNSPAGNALRVNGKLRVDDLRNNTIAASGARPVMVGTDGQLGTNAAVLPRILFATINGNDCSILEGGDGLTTLQINPTTCRISYAAFPSRPTITGLCQTPNAGSLLVTAVSTTLVDVSMFNPTTGSGTQCRMHVHIIGSQ